MGDPLVHRDPEISNTRKGNIMARARMIALLRPDGSIQRLANGTAIKRRSFFGYNHNVGRYGLGAEPYRGSV